MRRDDTQLSRHPGDALRLALAVALFVGVLVVARGSVPSASELDAFRLVNGLPRVLTAVAYPLLALGSVPAVAAFVLLALGLRRLRLAGDLLAASAIGLAVSELLHHAGIRSGPGEFSALLASRSLLDVPAAMHHVTGFPSSAVALAAAAATAAAPFLSRPGRRVVWSGAVAVAFARLYAGLDLPVDVVGGFALGWAVGAALNLIVGVPVGHPALDEVRRALGRLGLDATTLRFAAVGQHADVHYLAAGDDGRTLLVRVLGREERSADLLLRAFRFAVYRGVEDTTSFSARSGQLEHEAMVTTMARRGGVRAPEIIGVGPSTGGVATLVEQHLAGPRLDEMRPDALDHDLLVDVWREVGRLHAAAVAHGRLRRHAVVVDPERCPWIVGFAAGRTGATHDQRSRDVAELLVSLAVAVGVDRAVDAALEGVGSEPLLACAPFLQPLAVSTPTLREVVRKRHVVAALRTRIVEATGAEEPPLAQVTRVRPRTVLVLLAAGFAVNLLLPRVGQLQQTLEVIQHGTWWWLLAGAGATAVTWLAAALSQMGAVSSRLPLWRTTVVQIASCFTNRIAPAGIGGLGLNERYLERQGLDRPAAMGALGINVLGGAVVHATGVFISLGLLGEAGVGGVPLPDGWGVLVAVVVVSVIAGVVVFTPLGRRLREPARRAARDLVTAARRPRQALQLFGGSAGVTAFNALALAASLAAFTTSVDVVQVFLVYLGGSAVASVSPTPGQLGAVEAALVAGLTGVGMAAAPAVAGVLAFRLLTFWLPTLPGIVAFRWLRRRQFV